MVRGEVERLTMMHGCLGATTRLTRWWRRVSTRRKQAVLRASLLASLPHYSRIPETSPVDTFIICTSLCTAVCAVSDIKTDNCPHPTYTRYLHPQSRCHSSKHRFLSASQRQRNTTVNPDPVTSTFTSTSAPVRRDPPNGKFPQYQVHALRSRPDRGGICEQQLLRSDAI